MTRRQQTILDHLDLVRACSYETLAEMLGVSTMTVRRDAEALADQGTVIKTLGGVRKGSEEGSSLYESSLLSRRPLQHREKQAIALKALELIKPGLTVFIDGGTTCLELAKLIGREKTGLTLITNSIEICRTIGQNGNHAIIGLGGQYDPVSLSFMGSACEEEAGKFFTDMALFSTKGFRPADGTYESFIPTLRIKQIIARQCRRVVLLADHTKFGQRALRKVLDISQIHEVVTDSAISPRDLAILRAKKKTVWVAGEKPTRKTL